jgi:NADPH2:quinone reductase
MSAPLIIPHSDGAGEIDAVGAGVSGRMGERVWIWNGQWKRAYGTAAQYISSRIKTKLEQSVNEYAWSACLRKKVFVASTRDTDPIRCESRRFAPIRSSTRVATCVPLRAFARFTDSATT